MIKSYIKSILTVLIYLVIFNIYGCKSDSSELTEEQIMLGKMTKTWSLAQGSVVMLDGQDVTKIFQGFNISVSNDKTYSSVNGNAPIWPESGFFEFETSNGVKNLKRIIRDDGVIIDITTISDNTFNVKFYYDPANVGGRVKAIQGEFEFYLVSE